MTEISLAGKPNRFKDWLFAHPYTNGALLGLLLLPQVHWGAYLLFVNFVAPETPGPLFIHSPEFSFVNSGIMVYRVPGSLIWSVILGATLANIWSLWDAGKRGNSQYLCRILGLRYLIVSLAGFLFEHFQLIHPTLSRNSTWGVLFLELLWQSTFNPSICLILAMLAVGWVPLAVISSNEPYAPAPRFWEPVHRPAWVNCAISASRNRFHTHPRLHCCLLGGFGAFVFQSVLVCVATSRLWRIQPLTYDEGQFLRRLLESYQGIAIFCGCFLGWGIGHAVIHWKTRRRRVAAIVLCCLGGASALLSGIGATMLTLCYRPGPISAYYRPESPHYWSMIYLAVISNAVVWASVATSLAGLLLFLRSKSRS